MQAQRNAENTVMQALESLNDNQVNDFLSGKSPLNLSVRLGDHLMMIQLQLSTLSPSQQNSLKQKVMNGASLKQTVGRSIINCGNNVEPSSSSMSFSSGCKRLINNSDSDHSMGPEKQRLKTEGDETKSPIKSLSSMVSSPLSTTTVQNHINHNFYKTSSASSSPSVDPISANLTSCLCKRLSISCNNNCNDQRTSEEPCCSSSLPSTSSASMNSTNQPRLIPFHHRPSSSSSSSSGVRPKQIHQSQNQQQQQKTTSIDVNETLLNTDNPALAEASRNLTQTLRKLSKRVFTSKAHIMENNAISRSTTSSSSSSTSTSSNPSTSNNSSTSNSSGAVIESMKHHGKGIYSGTFSGTLNPALQDKNGKPKRDISTIIHILNDLLSATPQCAKNGAKIFFEPTQTSSSSSSNTKFIKIKKQSSSRTTCMRCVPNNVQQKCLYGQCNGHKTDVASTSNSTTCIPSTSSSATRSEGCTECNQTLINQKLEMENMKTKSKLDQLKLVMQQKKERREARKLKCSPYNTQHSPHLNISAISNAQTVSVPLLSANNSMNNANANHNRINSSGEAPLTATISSENHLEEVETVA
ncbi:midnolin homolog [Chironomus tepperi]|uniref:midnolin homolog n=1 Tax=Chironomus tepperi TaxID=113505 RepID=UPI00391F2221